MKGQEHACAHSEDVLGQHPRTREPRAMMTYATVETILAGMFGAEGEAQKKAFRGRLKHLKRLGIPLEFNPGKGAKGEYSDEYMEQMAFCLELAEFGVDPTAIVQFVQANWRTEILPKIMEAGDIDRDLYFISAPRLMSSNWSKQSKFTIGWMDAEKLQAEWAHPSAARRRMLIINISALVKQLNELRTANKV